MLEIKNLQAGIEDKPILKGIDLSVNAGEVHAIMGPNGSGKARSPRCSPGATATMSPAVKYCCRTTTCSTSPRRNAPARSFLAFQYPVEIPGVNSAYFYDPPSTRSASIAAKRNSMR